MHRTPRAAARRFLAVGLGLLVLAATAACGGGDDAPAPSGPPAILAAVDLGEQAVAAAAGEGAVWVVDGRRTLWRVDPGTNRVTATIPVETGAGAVATGEGAVWVSGPGGVSRVDPAGPRVTGTARLGAPRGLAAGHGAVWVADTADGGTLRRVDAKAMRVDASIKVPGLPGDDLPLPQVPSHVAVGEGGVWVTDSRVGTVSRVDRAKNSFTLTMSRVGFDIRGLAIGKGWLWVVSVGGLTRAQPGDRSPNSLDVGDDPVGVAVGDRAVWVVNSGNNTLSRVDPDSGRETIAVRTEERPVAVAVGFDSVWVLGRDGLLARYAET